MGKKTVFQCEECGKTAEVAGEIDKIPSCCGHDMKNITKLPFCTRAAVPEHERIFGKNEPCDDRTDAGN